MGFIRSFLLMISAGLFLVLLISMNICFTINSSLDYDILKPSAMSLSEKMLLEQGADSYIDQELEFMRGYCNNNTNFSYEFEGEAFLFECETISEGPDSIVDSVIDQNPDFSNQEDLLEQQITENYKVFSDYCESHSEFVIEDIKQTEEVEGSIDMDSIKIDCDAIENGTEEVLENIMSNYFDEIYYKNYDCVFSAKNLFFDCFSTYKSPFFLVSEQAKNYWYDKLVSLLIINLVLAGAIFLFIEKKSNWFIVVGIFSIIASLPFFNLDWLMFVLDNQYLEIYKTFFTQHYQTFLMSFLFGLIMIGLGIAFKFFKLGIYITRKIENISKKFTKKHKENSEKKDEEDSKDIEEEKEEPAEVKENKDEKKHDEDKKDSKEE